MDFSGPNREFQRSSFDYSPCDIEVSAKIRGKEVSSMKLDEGGPELKAIFDAAIQSSEVNVRELLSSQRHLAIHPSQEQLGFLQQIFEVLAGKTETDDIEIDFHQSPNISSSLASDLHLANSETYGNKAANLIRLQEILLPLEKQGLAVSVPSFLPLAHMEIQTHLDKVLPSWRERWQEFIQTQGESSSTDRASGLSETAQKLLVNLGVDIREAFAENPLTIDGLESFLGIHRALLMVRSTGKEDTETLANAGGNESIAAVEPTVQDISSAIGRVVASYFSIKSIEQRLLEKDDVTSLPFMPVLIQVMVGEGITKVEHPEETPVSGVMFSQEAEGQTAKVTHIQGSFGHGEGIVNGLVPIDSYYVKPDGSIHSVIRRKDKKMTNKPFSTELVIENTPISIQSKAAIPHEKIRQLGQIAQAIEKHYKRPMDIEWVYDCKTDQIYIVQARPIVHKRANNASTLNLSNLKGCEKLKGTTIGAAGGALRLVTSPSQVIIAKTLNEALSRFFKLPDRKGISAVIVENMAPATSHEATTFRGLNIPVIRLADIASIEEWVNREKAFVVDPQRELAVDLSDYDITSLEDLEEKDLVIRGWARHPISARLSLAELEEMTEEQVEKIVEDLQPKQSGKVGPQQKLEDPYSDLHLRTLIENMAASHDPHEIKTLLMSVLQRLVRHKKRLIAEDSPLLSEFNTVLRQSLIIAKEISLAASDFESAEGSSSSGAYQYEEAKTNLLYACNWLEATLFQQSEPDVIGDTSYVETLKEQALLNSISTRETPEDEELLQALESREKRLLSRLSPSFEKASIENKKLSTSEKEAFFIQYMKIQKLALNADLAESWETFVRLIAKSGSQLHNSQLSFILKKTQQLGIIPFWINTVFSNAWRDVGGRPDRCLDLLLQETRAISDTVFQLSEKNEILEKWKGKISQWSDPANFDSLWEEFQEDVLESMLDPYLFDRLEKTSLPLEKMVVIEFFTKVTDLYDQTIKSMKGSPEYTDKPLQVRHFSTMLKSFLGMMEKCINLIPEDVMNSWCSWATLENRKNNVIKTIQKQFRLLEGNSRAEMLYPSSMFSVAAATISSGALPARSIERAISLEDLFTLFHQNILVSLATINPVKTDFMRNLPPVLQTFSSALSEGFEQSQPNLASINYNYPKVSLLYNIPLRNHSGNFTVNYDLKTGRCTLSFFLFGNNDFRRMDHGIEYAQIGTLLYGLAFINSPSYDSKNMLLSCAWEFPLAKSSAQSLARALHHQFGLMIKQTFSQDSLPLYEKVEKIVESPDARAAMEVNENLGAVHKILHYQLKFQRNPKDYDSLRELIHIAREMPTETSEIETVILILVRSAEGLKNVDSFSVDDCRQIDNLISDIIEQVKRVYSNTQPEMIESLKDINTSRFMNKIFYLDRGSPLKICEAINNMTAQQQTDLFKYLASNPQRMKALFREPIIKESNDRIEDDLLNFEDIILSLLRSEGIKDYLDVAQLFLDKLAEEIVLFSSFSSEGNEMVENLLDRVKNQVQVFYEENQLELLKGFRDLNVRRFCNLPKPSSPDDILILVGHIQSMTKRQKIELFTYLANHPEHGRQLFATPPHQFALYNEHSLDELQHSISMLLDLQEITHFPRAHQLFSELRESAYNYNRKIVEDRLSRGDVENIGKHLQMLSSCLEKYSISPLLAFQVQPGFYFKVKENRESRRHMEIGSFTDITNALSSNSVDCLEEEVPFGSAKRCLEIATKLLEKHPQKTEEVLPLLFTINVQLSQFEEAFTLFDQLTENLTLDRWKGASLLIRNIPSFLSPLQFVLVRQLIEKTPQEVASEISRSDIALLKGTLKQAVTAILSKEGEEELQRCKESKSSPPQELWIASVFCNLLQQGVNLALQKKGLFF